MFTLQINNKAVEYSPEELLGQIVGYLQEHEIPPNEIAMVDAIKKQLSSAWECISPIQLIDISFRAGARYHLISERYNAVFSGTVDPSSDSSGS